jgi:hypothetical protein
MTYEFRVVTAQFRRNPVWTIAAMIFAAYVAYTVAQFIVSDNLVGMAYVALIFAGVAAVVAILMNWRNGLYFFLAWLLFEDLARKYLGNNMVIFFGKDVLVIVVYLSFFLAYRRGEVRSFRPPFLIPLMIFFWFGIMQVFNPGSPSFFFGLLGMKIYFLYMPLMLIGYSLVETEEDIRRFFKFCMVIAIVICGLGVAQAVMGHTFLNPTVIQEDIRDLSMNYRVAPLSGAKLYRPNSVFVSTGRFGFYLIPAWLISFGFTAYLVLRRRGRLIFLLALGALGTCTLGVVMAGSRAVIAGTSVSLIVATAAFLWGAPWEQGQVLRVFRYFSRAMIAGALAMGLMSAFYPEAVASRLEFYSETLLPSGSQSQFIERGQDYPIRNFLDAFSYARWDIGYGIGTFSLGTQYITRYMKIPQVGPGTESGYGGLVLELGVGGLILWLIMSTAIVVTAFRVVIKLRGTAWFPVGFVIMWFAFDLLFPQTFIGLTAYQDYLLNAHLWLLLGILFRLPHIPFSSRFNLSTAGAGTAPQGAH